jgi:lipoyl(octanoyl) transferase
VTFDEAVRLQRGLIYRLSGGEGAASLLLCEHPPLVTVGRHGAVPLGLLGGKPAAEAWPVRWVGRGGGAILHLPGQLAAYPVLPLWAMGLGVADYLRLLQGAVTDLLDDFAVRGETRAGEAGVWVGGRLIASVGVALRQGVTAFGVVLNVDPDLTQFRRLASDDAFTSLARERRGPARPQLVRQRFLGHFAARFGFGRVEILFPAADQPGHERVAAR